MLLSDAELAQALARAVYRGDANKVKALVRYSRAGHNLPEEVNLDDFIAMIMKGASSLGFGGPKEDGSVNK